MNVPLPDTLGVLVRGWLHGNVIFFSGERLAIVDTGYWSGVDELAEAFEAHTGRPVDELADIYLTHVHADHSGGTAELVERSAATVHAHAKCKALTSPWDEHGLWMVGMGQRLPEFGVDRTLVPGDEFEAGELIWRTIDLPGHARGGVGFYNAKHRLLIAGDALWEQGLGMLQPWIDGEQVFDEAERALDTIASLDVDVVVAGHGEPFGDVSDAIERARHVLGRWRRNPERMGLTGKLSALSFWLLAHPGSEREAFESMALEFMRTRHDVDLSRFEEQTRELCALAFQRRLAVEREGRIFPGAGMRG